MHLQKPGDCTSSFCRFAGAFGILVYCICLCSNPAFADTLRQVGSADLPTFHDDFDRSSLLQAARRQIEQLQRMPQKKRIDIAGNTYIPRQLIDSISAFIRIAETADTDQEVWKNLGKNFTVYQAAGTRKNDTYGEMLVTGYYEPIFDGSLKCEPPFLFPLYVQPPDLKSKRSAGTGKIITGRISKGDLTPYWTRAEIESRNILKGSELVYLRDPFEVFLLHVQGSGKIRLPDGSLRSVEYAASNGHPYRSIGKLLVEENRFPLAEATLPAIEGYLRENPDDMTRVLHYNPRFIFFRWGDNKGPRGSTNTQLTAGRSIAIDHQVLPSGTIGFLHSRRPVFDQKGALAGWVPIQRFVFPQDSGAAIEGPGRVDLFLGDSEEARRSAGLMKEPGNLYFLLKK
jgi:membrane-bound lytic murein transglycosylase A